MHRVNSSLVVHRSHPLPRAATKSISFVPVLCNLLISIGFQTITKLSRTTDLVFTILADIFRAHYFSRLRSTLAVTVRCEARSLRMSPIEASQLSYEIRLNIQRIPQRKIRRDNSVLRSVVKFEYIRHLPRNPGLD